MPEGALVTELASRLSGIAIISTDINDNDIEGQDSESLVAYIADYFKESDRPGLLTKDLLVKIIDEKRVVAAPKVEIIKAPDFKPLGKDIPSEFKIRNVEVHKTVGTVLDFTHYFNDRLQKIRGFLQEGRGSRMSGLVKSIDAIKQYASGKEVTVVGMVYDKIITKNGHVLITLEDETGSAKILFAKQDKRIANSLFENSNRIIVDEVIAVRGKLSGSLLIASELVYPDIPVHNRKATEEDVAIAFMSDVHVGSKLFMEKQFLRFIEWVNGGLDYRKDLAQKIKYITVSGDLVDGIGVYPDQQKELAIDDIYKQYNELFNLFSKVPDYIEIFLITGNHDGVQRAEPQPQLPEGFYKDFRHLQNIHLVTNPGYININGLQVLGYHGTSLDSIIQGIPGCSYSKPETAMLEVLKRRHLSPIYGDNPIVPGKGDSMVIDQVPDILHMGHLHKNGSAEHHGTLIVNSGTWQGRTSFQVRMGHVPTPAILPIYETKSMKFQQMDFNMQT